MPWNPRRPVVVFNPPPGWPPAPPGWLPPHGWVPPKKWPSPPPMWDFLLELPNVAETPSTISYREAHSAYIDHSGITKTSSRPTMGVEKYLEYGPGTMDEDSFMVGRKTKIQLNRVLIPIVLLIMFIMVVTNMVMRTAQYSVREAISACMSSADETIRMELLAGKRGSPMSDLSNLKNTKLVSGPGIILSNSVKNDEKTEQYMFSGWARDNIEGIWEWKCTATKTTDSWETSDSTASPAVKN